MGPGPGVAVTVTDTTSNTSVQVGSAVIPAVSQSGRASLNTVRGANRNPSAVTADPEAGVTQRHQDQEHLLMEVVDPAGCGCGWV